MNNDIDDWQWVDEDPFEKLLRTPKSAAIAHSSGQSAVEGLEPVRLEEPPGGDFAITDSEPGHFDPPVCPEDLGQAVQSPAKTVEVDIPAPPAESSSQNVAAELNVPAVQFDGAVSSEKVQQWKSAANSFRRDLELEPGCADSLIGLGACLLHLDATEEALNCFEQCGFSGAERKRALLGKAVALQKLNRYEAANQAYRELLQMIPDSPELLANVIALSVARRDTAAVAEYSNRLLRVDPLNKAALQGLATLAIWNGDQMAAIDYCTRLVKVDPLSVEGWHNLAFANHRMRPSEQAMRSIA
jgi:tetratricopeptide (TPR) repeat protein